MRSAIALPFSTPGYQASSTDLTPPSQGRLTGAPASITTTVFGLAAATVFTSAFSSCAGPPQPTETQTAGPLASNVVRSVPSDSLSAITTIATSAWLATAVASAEAVPSE